MVPNGMSKVRKAFQKSNVVSYDPLPSRYRQQYRDGLPLEKRGRNSPPRNTEQARDAITTTYRTKRRGDYSEECKASLFPSVSRNKAQYPLPGPMRVFGMTILPPARSIFETVSFKSFASSK